MLSALAVLASQSATPPVRQGAAQASTPKAIEVAEHGLASVAGPDDEGPYRLIDPIGPGGVSNAAAADEVFSPKLQGGNYGYNSNAEPAGYP